jgi:NAD(P)H-flavin reductase
MRAQYVEFLLRDGSRRSYSMANAPHTLDAAAPKVELHIRHMPGGKFTDVVFSTMKEKDILRIEGPYGSFFLREDSNAPLILLASGTGFAPIKALIETHATQRHHASRHFVLGRSPSVRFVHERLGRGPSQIHAQLDIHSGCV